VTCAFCSLVYEFTPHEAGAVATHCELICFGRKRNFVRQPSSSSATGSAEWPPDDRLRQTIQYSRDVDDESIGRGVLDSPPSRGMTAVCYDAVSPSLRAQRSKQCP